MVKLEVLLLELVVLVPVAVSVVLQVLLLLAVLLVVPELVLLMLVELVLVPELVELTVDDIVALAAGKWEVQKHSVQQNFWLVVEPYPSDKE